MTTKSKTPLLDEEEQDSLSANVLVSHQLTTYQGGYDCELTSPMPDELVCLICRCIARVPHQVTCCGRVFCEGCLTLLKLFSEKRNTLYECPHCRKTIQSFVDVRAASHIRSLEVKCKNVCNGCEWVGKLSSLEKHQDECGFALITCPYEDGDNPMKFLRRNHLEHYSDECPRRMYKCSYCHLSGEYRDIVNTHLQECPNYTLPVITIQPSDQSMRIGGIVKFDVCADRALHYQWSKDGQDITSATHPYCRGATTATLNIRSVAVEHEGIYSCAVRNDCGSVDSKGVQLVVITTPTITESPCDQTKMYGDSVVFKVIATGKGNLCYQWSKDDEDITPYTHPYCTGGDTPTLNIAGVITQYEGSYSCYVTNEAGCVESKSATLGVVSPATRLFLKESTSTVNVENDEDTGGDEQMCYPAIPPLNVPTQLSIGRSTIESKDTAARRGIQTVVSDHQTARYPNLQLTLQCLSPSSSSIVLPSNVKLFSPIYSVISSTQNIIVEIIMSHYAIIEPGEDTSDFIILQSVSQAPPYYFKCLRVDENMSFSVLQESISCSVKVDQANFFAIGASVWRRARFNVYFIQPQPKVSQQCMYVFFAASYKHAVFEELLLSEVKRRFTGVDFQLSKHSVHLREGSDRFELVPQKDLKDLGYSLIPVNKGSVTILASDLLERDANKDPRLCMPPCVLLRVEMDNPFEDLDCLLHLSGAVGNDHKFSLLVEGSTNPQTDTPEAFHTQALVTPADGAAMPTTESDTLTKISPEHVSVLVEILCTYAGKWRQIGTCLGFTQAELNTIEADLRLLVRGPTAYLTAMLDQWMQWPIKNLGVEHKQCATLEDLEQALMSRLVGLGVEGTELRVKFQQGCEEKERRIRMEAQELLQANNQPEPNTSKLRCVFL